MGIGDERYTTWNAAAEPELLRQAKDFKFATDATKLPRRRYLLSHHFRYP